MSLDSITFFFAVPPTLVPKVGLSHDSNTRRFPPTALFNFFSPQTDLMGCNGPSAPRPSNCHFPWSPPSFDSSCLSLILAGSQRRPEESIPEVINWLRQTFRRAETAATLQCGGWGETRNRRKSFLGQMWAKFLRCSFFRLFRTSASFAICSVCRAARSDKPCQPLRKHVSYPELSGTRREMITREWLRRVFSLAK